MDRQTDGRTFAFLELLSQLKIEVIFHRESDAITANVSLSVCLSVRPGKCLNLYQTLINALWEGLSCKCGVSFETSAQGLLIPANCS